MTGDSSLPHWRIQWPLTRSPALRLVTDDDYFSGIAAACSGVTHCMPLPSADPAEVADIQRRRHPPRGLPRSGLRLQWPAVRIVIARKERPHPGAQLRFTDVDGHRVTAFATDTGPEQQPNGQ